MKIASIQKFSSKDWEGKISAVLFCYGCNLRCIYCHNPELIFPAKREEVPWEDVIEFLKTRQGKLDAVVFSGGEPTIYGDDFIERLKEVKEMGFLTGVHTPGTNRETLIKALDHLDWIGYDIKCLPERYAEITGSEKITNTDNPWITLREILLLRQSKKVPEIEVRTTWRPGLFPEKELIEISKRLVQMGIFEWCIQTLNEPISGIDMHYIDFPKLRKTKLSSFIPDYPKHLHPETAREINQTGMGTIILR